MDLYVSEIGNTKGITLKSATPEKRESVYYNGEEFLIAASFAGFLSTDQKDVLDRYAAFKRMFGEIRDVYENKDFEALKKFVVMVMNNRNFIFTICSKPYLLAKVTYINLHGINHYSSRGNATLTITDIARLKDEFVYPLLYACSNPSNENFKKLLTIFCDCPCYYLCDNRNDFKENMRRLLWRKDYSVYAKSIYNLDLDDAESSNQLFSLISLASLTSRWNINTEVEEFKINQLKVYHSTSYKYDQDRLLKMKVPFFKIEYIHKAKSELLTLIEDINFIFHAEFTRMNEIFRNNGDYNNEHFKFVSLLVRQVGLSNFEFQMPVNEWTLIIGVMDLIRDCVGEIYTQNHIVDFLVLSHYFRTCEYLKNHGEELNADKVFKTRV